MSSNATSPILKRLNSTDIVDKLPTSFNAQGEPLIRLMRIDLNYNYQSPYGSPVQYQDIVSAYQASPTDLAFNQYGSLISFSNPQFIFYTSPYEPDPSQIELSSKDIINGTSTAFVYGQISNYPTQNAMAPNSITFVSPQNAQWILNVKPDTSNAGYSIFSIYFHPLQNPSLSENDISSNISQFCNLISNADPMCFCQKGTTCTNSAIGGSANASQLQSSNSDYYNQINSNCACLSNQCQYAAKNESNQYAKSFVCDNAPSACGSTFSYSRTYGLLSGNSQTLVDACNLNPIQSNIPAIPIIPAPNTNTTPITPTTTTTPPPPPANQPPSSRDSNTGLKIGISIVIVLIIFLVMYFMMK